MIDSRPAYAGLVGYWSSLNTRLKEIPPFATLAVGMVAAAVISLFLAYWLSPEKGVPRYDLFQAQRHLEQSQAEAGKLRTQIGDLEKQLGAGHERSFQLQQKLEETAGMVLGMQADQEALGILTHDLASPLGQMRVFASLFQGAADIKSSYDPVLELWDGLFDEFHTTSEAARNAVRASILGYGSEGVTSLYKRLHTFFVAMAPESILRILMDNQELLTAKNVDWRTVGADYELWFNKCKFNQETPDCAPSVAAVQKAFGVESLTELQWVNIGRVYRLWLRAGQDGDALIKAGQAAFADLLDARGVHLSTKQ